MARSLHVQSVRAHLVDITFLIRRWESCTRLNAPPVQQFASTLFAVPHRVNGLAFRQEKASNGREVPLEASLSLGFLGGLPMGAGRSRLEGYFNASQAAARGRCVLVVRFVAFLAVDCRLGASCATRC